MRKSHNSAWYQSLYDLSRGRELSSFGMLEGMPYVVCPCNIFLYFLCSFGERCPSCLSGDWHLPFFSDIALHPMPLFNDLLDSIVSLCDPFQWISTFFTSLFQSHHAYFWWLFGQRHGSFPPFSNSKLFWQDSDDQGLFSQIFNLKQVSSLWVWQGTLECKELMSE